MTVTQVRPALCSTADCVAHQALLSTGLSRRILEWVAFPSPGDLPDPGIEPGSLASKTESLSLSHGGGPQWSVQTLKRNLIFLFPVVCEYVSHSVVSSSLHPHVV